MPIGPAKQAALKVRMAELGILEDELEESFILGSGSGGQKINKTHSCVRLKHLPSQLEIKCQQTRSRELNRYYARVELCERIETQRQGEQSRRQQEAEKIRRQKRRRSRRAKEKMLADKRYQAAKKKQRATPQPNDD